MEQARRALGELVRVMGGDARFWSMGDRVSHFRSSRDDRRSAELPSHAPGSALEHVRWTGEVHTSARWLMAHVAAGSGSLVAVPLMVDDEVRGAVGVERDAAAAPFEAEDLELLEVLAPQLLSVMEIARMREVRAQVSRRLARAEDGEALGRVARSIAHDFGNVLVVLQLALEGLSERTDMDAGANELEAMRQAVLRLVELTRNLERHQPNSGPEAS
jgi:GAF domain-containing protein